MTITTKLIIDGNSTAVRIPKHALEESGLSSSVTMRVSRGKITLMSAPRPRALWVEQMARVLNTTPLSTKNDKTLSDWETTTYDGIEKKH